MWSPIPKKKRVEEEDEKMVEFSLKKIQNKRAVKIQPNH